MYRLNFCTPIPGLQPARGVQALFVKREAKQNILLNAFEGDTQPFPDLTSNEKEKKISRSSELQQKVAITTKVQESTQ